MSKIPYSKTDDFKIEKYTSKPPQPDMHYHHAYEIYYILEGEREYFIGDTFFKMSQGDLAWVPTNMLHRTDGRKSALFIIYFKSDFIKKYATSYMLDKLLSDTPFVFHANAATDAQLTSILNKLLAEYELQCKQPQYADELLIIDHLLKLLFLLYTSENIYHPILSEDSRISRIIKYINENYAYITSMEDVADRFFISKYYMCRIFKETIGVSFVSYLNTIRIKAACDLLKSEDIYLSEVAIRCGFNSTPYFCKVFKDEKGVSPTEYRNKFK